MKTRAYMGMIAPEILPGWNEMQMMTTYAHGRKKMYKKKYRDVFGASVKTLCKWYDGIVDKTSDLSRERRGITLDFCDFLIRKGVIQILPIKNSRGYLMLEKNKKTV